MTIFIPFHYDPAILSQLQLQPQMTILLKTGVGSNRIIAIDRQHHHPPQLTTTSQQLSSTEQEEHKTKKHQGRSHFYPFLVSRGCY